MRNTHFYTTNDNINEYKQSFALIAMVEVNGDFCICFKNVSKQHSGDTLCTPEECGNVGVIEVIIIDNDRKFSD